MEYSSVKEQPMRKSANSVRKPVQARSMETRNQIMKAGEELFRKKGLNGTNSKEIAKKAGVSVGSFYAYFADKKALYFKVLEVYSEKIFIKLPDISEKYFNSPNRIDNFYSIIKNIIEAHYAPELQRDLYSMYHQNEELREIVKAWQKKAIDQFHSHLQNASISSSIKDPLGAAVLIHTLMEAVVQRVTIYGSSVGEDRLVREFAVMLERYFFPGN